MKSLREISGRLQVQARKVGKFLAMVWIEITIVASIRKLGMETAQWCGRHYYLPQSFLISKSEATQWRSEDNSSLAAGVLAVGLDKLAFALQLLLPTQNLLSAIDHAAFLVSDSS
jgi:uncharacterized protein involved in response to NO